MNINISAVINPSQQATLDELLDFISSHTEHHWHSSLESIKLEKIGNAVKVKFWLFRYQIEVYLADDYFKLIGSDTKLTYPDDDINWLELIKFELDIE